MKPRCPKVGPPLNAFPQAPALGRAHRDPAHAAKGRARSQESKQQVSCCFLMKTAVPERLLVPPITVPKGGFKEGDLERNITSEWLKHDFYSFCFWSDPPLSNPPLGDAESSLWLFVTKTAVPEYNIIS